MSHLYNIIAKEFSKIGSLEFSVTDLKDSGGGWEGRHFKKLIFLIENKSGKKLLNLACYIDQSSLKLRDLSLLSTSAGILIHSEWTNWRDDRVEFVI